MRRTVDRLALVGLLSMVAALGVVAEEPVEGERFENETAGIALTRPAGWTTASIQEVEANRRRVRLPDEQLQQAVAESATAPLFVFTQYPEPHEDLNPSIQVVLRPLGPLAGRSPVEIMRTAVAPLQQLFDGFEFVEEIHPTEVSGMPAARMSATYSIENDEGRTFDTLSVMWIVPRGGFMFMLGMSGPADASEEMIPVFESTIGTVEIDE